MGTGDAGSFGSGLVQPITVGEWFDFALGGVPARQSGRSQLVSSANILPPTGGGFFSGACLGQVGMLRAADRAVGHRAHRDACSLAAVTLLCVGPG